MTALVSAPPGSPFKGLERYDEADAPDFFGRDADAELVVANVLAARLTLLFGESGVGKSSLLHAGVVPRLRARGDLVAVVFSDWHGDAAASLRDAVRAAGGLEPGPGDEPLAAAIAACAGRAGRDLIVILDQVEEYFVYHPGEDAFSLEFPRAVAQEDLPVSFLIAIREDALARLERFKGRIPGLFDTYLRLDRLSRDAARETIVAPLARRAALEPADAVTVEPDLVERLLDEVEVGRVAFGSAGIGASAAGGAAAERSIEAPYLQLVLSRLWDEERGAGSSVLRLETLQRLGGAERIVRTHLDVALEGLGPDGQEVAAAVFRYLVTPSGTKIAHRVEDLAEYSGHPPATVAAVLERLAAGTTRVVRPVGDDAYEIYHDVLAAAVLDWRARYLHARELASVDGRRRLRWRLALGALVVAILAGVAAGLTIWRVQADRTAAARRAEQPQALELARAALYARSVYTGHRDVLQSVAFSPDGRRAVSADQSGDVRVWTAATGRELARLRLGGTVQQADFSPDGALVVAANGKGKVAIWRWRTGEQVASLTEPGLDGAAFGPGGRLVALPGDDGTIRLWDWRAGRVVAILDGKDGVVRTAVFSDDGRLLVSSSDDGDARVWDWRAQRVLAKLPARVSTGSPNAVAFSPDARYVATAGERGGLVWDWRARRVVWSRSPDNEYGSTTVAFSPDGTIVALGDGDDTAVRLWNWRRGRQVAVLREGVGSSGLAFSPSGCLVATSGYDRWARVWAPPLPGCGR